MVCSSCITVSSHRANASRRDKHSHFCQRCRQRAAIAQYCGLEAGRVHSLRINAPHLLHATNTSSMHGINWQLHDWLIGCNGSRCPAGRWRGPSSDGCVLRCSISVAAIIGSPHANPCPSAARPSSRRWGLTRRMGAPCWRAGIQCRLCRGREAGARAWVCSGSPASLQIARRVSSPQTSHSWPASGCTQQRRNKRDAGRWSSTLPVVPPPQGLLDPLSRCMHCHMYAGQGGSWEVD
jgi:hypothetical protein